MTWKNYLGGPGNDLEFGKLKSLDTLLLVSSGKRILSSDIVSSMFNLLCNFGQAGYGKNLYKLSDLIFFVRFDKKKLFKIAKSWISLQEDACHNVKNTFRLENASL